MARIIVLGGHGKVALLLEPLLVARGDTVTAVIRNQDHEADVVATGATPVVDVPGVVMPVDIGGTLLLAPALSLPSVAWRVAAFEPRGPPLT